MNPFSLGYISDDDLRAEVERRAKKEELVGRTTIPTTVPNMDFSDLVATVTEGVGKMVAEQHEDENFKHYVYEAAINAIYGDRFWAWRRGQAF